ncbi:trypsin-like peptidase domain-containing protein [Pedobacter sp. MC2016-05]|uniref:trypsin-like peptidase domain-containing protein n=1 Tax=Pedobacter sp. MC2016-05 TaxID=2994474 RepID=UPI002246B45A|nr:trypsin-like peptidase domain-containing protein [Pedobacter sp. MC2016-05]MCX2474283.1 trypsin-like peptidase domain-containing protein [Pedobacter sp. MC2016-05]
MKKILGITVLAAFIGGAAAIGGYKLFERNQTGSTISEKQNLYFANNPLKVSSAGTADFTQAAAAVAPGVVHIKTTYEAKSGGGSRNSSPFDMFDDFFGGGGRQMQRQPRAASGSGVIISQDGYIVTNNHVVENASKVEVVLTDRRKVEAKVIGRDPNTDLALIKVNATGLPVVKMGNSDNVQVGEWVLAVGFPLDLQTTVTAGIVSAKNRSIGIIGREQQGNEITEEEYREYQRTGKRPQAPANTSIESFIQTDAAINPGNSGGALVNANGELVGINSAIASQSGYNQGYGFAIPVNLARKIVDDFMKYGMVKRGYIGVNFYPLSGDEKPEGITTSEVSGLYVSDVVAGGGGAAAGIKKGDIIKKVDGVVINDSPDLQERIGRMNPGDKVKLSVLRDGSLKDITVTLKGESSIGLTANNAATKNVEVSKLGATFAPATQAQKTKFGINSGVVVTSVVTGKAFDNIGVEKGLIITKVNGQPVNSVADVQKALPQGRNNMISISGVGEQGTYNFSFPAQ